VNIKKWLQNIADSFQPAADRIRAWKLSPEIDELLDKVWMALPKTVQDAAFKFIMSIYNKYGKEKAAKIIADIVRALRNLPAQ